MTRVDLSTALRKALEKAVEQARIAAETGAADAIRRLGVAAVSPPPHLNVAQGTPRAAACSCPQPRRPPPQ
jgi:hypothetical protein